MQGRCGRIRSATHCAHDHNVATVHAETCLLSVQVPSGLIYRASRDGFKFDDWLTRCAGKGPTMTLVKVSRLRRLTGPARYLRISEDCGCFLTVGGGK